MTLQILLFLFLFFTFEYENNIWYVLLFIGALIPIVGLIASPVCIMTGYMEAFSSYPDLNLKDNKMNRWLYAGYFNNMK
jgi:hypothetical protein